MKPKGVAAAAGMVSVQAQCTPDEAVRLMEHRARALQQSVEDVAAAVVERRVRFVAQSRTFN